MKRIAMTIILHINLAIVVNAQVNNNDIISNKYADYFQNTREIVHLHLNKTSFLYGEEIWFKAYVLEQNSQKPHPTTTNLYVTLFDDEGNSKQQHLIHIKNGIGNGSFYIDSTFTKKNYFIKASTNWMKNFKEDNSFTQKIKIMSNAKKNKVQTTKEEEFYDFQVFPEGGHLVENVPSKIGILIKYKNNKGVKIKKGILKEQKTNKIIAKFNTNSFGLGSTTFNYSENKTYFLGAILNNGITIIKEVPLAKKRGIVLQVKKPTVKFLEITLATNKETLKNIAKTEFKIWIHNTNKIYKRTISFNQKDDAVTLFIKSNSLASEVNIITVFDHNNIPILERLVFNYDANLFIKPIVQKESSLSDSIVVSISNPLDIKLFLSASVLPVNTKAYQPNNTILTSFLLKPFIKGDIENANYYFDNINRKKLNDLDVLLLTQGWSKYNWYNIFNSKPSTYFDFENGIDVTMKFNQKLKPKQEIRIFLNDRSVYRTITQEENPFVLKNSIIKKNAEIYFGLKHKNSLLKIAPAISFSKYTHQDNLANKFLFHKNSIDEIEISDFNKLSIGTDILDEVILKSKVKKWDNEV